MDFGEFIAAFDTGFSKLFDRKTNKMLTKPYFCRYLLCSITKNETVVLYINGIEDKKHERSESAFQAFYRNKERRSLHPIAEKIIDSNSEILDRVKFVTFLEEYCKVYSKEKLLTNFKKYLPSTSPSTLFDDITNEFVIILENEAAIPDKRRKEAVSLNNANRRNESDDSVEAKMHILLNTLIITGREIAEFKPTGVGDDVRYLRLTRKLKKDFKQLLVFTKLLPQNTVDDKSSIYNDIRSSVQSLNAENFILSIHDFMVESLKNYHIHRLIELLSQLQDNH